MSSSESESEVETPTYRGEDPNRICNFSTKLTSDNIKGYRLPTFHNPPCDVIGASNNQGWWKCRFENFPLCCSHPIYSKKAEIKRCLNSTRFRLIYVMDGEEVTRDLTVEDYNRMVKGSKSRFGLGR